jgi:hypothetical protein
LRIKQVAHKEEILTRAYKWLTLLLAALVGCLSATTTPNPTQAPLASPSVSPLTSPLMPGEALIVYHRSGGIAGLDETWLIYPDGRVQYQGGLAGQAKQLTANQLNRLIEQVRASNFFQLKDSYVPADTCCDRFLYEITVSLDGRVKTVRTLQAEPDVPATLGNLPADINSILQGN